MQSLRDQLIKAGLIKEEQAEQKKPGRSPDAAASREERPIPELPPLALPGSKAHQRLAALQQLELDRRLRELVLAAQVPIEPGDCAFHFVTRMGKLRRLELSVAQVKQLEKGELAIVERPDPAQIGHSLVPPETADRMLRLSEKAVRFYNRKGSPIGFAPGDDDGSDGSPQNVP
jgi:uncharacterized protein YaiL (DUF2058 family)